MKNYIPSHLTQTFSLAKLIILSQNSIFISELFYQKVLLTRMASGRAKRLADLFHKFWSIRPAQGPIVSRHKALIRIHSDTEKGMAAIWSVEYTTRRSVVRCSWNAANIPPWCFFPWFHGSFTFAFYVIKTETFLEAATPSIRKGHKRKHGNETQMLSCGAASLLVLSTVFSRAGISGWSHTTRGHFHWKQTCFWSWKPDTAECVSICGLFWRNC